MNAKIYNNNNLIRLVDVFLCYSILFMACNQDLKESNRRIYLNKDSVSVLLDTTRNKSVSKDSLSRSEHENIDLVKWYGIYKSDDRWSEDDYKNKKDNGSKFGFHKLVIKKDSILFSLDLEGFTLVSYPEFTYLCNVDDINDTLYITFKNFVDGYNDRFPDNKPILKFYKIRNNYEAINNDFDALDLKEENGTAESFHKIGE